MPPATDPSAAVESVCQALALNIHRLLAESGATSADVALAAGVAKDTMRRAERGEGVLLDSLDRIASGLQVWAWVLLRPDALLVPCTGFAPPSKTTLALRLRQWVREDEARSMKLLQRLSGVTQPTLYRLLNPRLGASLATLARVAAAIGCAPWQLLVPISNLGDSEILIF